MNLRDLAYLVAVAEHLHFGRAARAVHVSQPTLSMQLKKLEETLGVQLFERSNKSVRLTAIGSDMVARARRMLDEAAQMKLAASAAHDPESGTLTLGIFPTLAPYLLPLLMPQITARFPKLRVQLVEEKTAALVEQLASGQIDAAMLAMPVDHPAFAQRAVFNEPFLLAAARSHPLSNRASVTMADLHHARLLLLEDGHCLRDQALAVCQLAGIAEATDFRATSLETLRHMVAASDAVTLMPELATRMVKDGLAYIPFAGTTPPQRAIGLYWRHKSARTGLFEALAELTAAVGSN